MTATRHVLQRLAVATLAAATVGAVVPTLVAAPAGAATAGISVTPKNRSTGATGTCIPFTVTLAGVGASDTNTVSIILTDPTTAPPPGPPVTAVPAATAQFCQTNAAGQLIATSSPSDATNPPTPGAVTTASPPAGKRQESFVTSPGQTTLQFGVFDTEEETVGIQAFVDTNGNGTLDPGTDNSSTSSARFTPGSATQDTTTNPGTFDQKANDNTKTLTATQTPAQQSSAIAGPGGSQVFTVTAKNTNLDPIRGVQVTYVVGSTGANGSTPATTGTCQITNNDGQTVCSVPTPKAGKDTITFYVNQTNGGQGSTTGTTGPDANEPQVAVNTVTSPAPANARTVTLSPNAQSFGAGSTVAYTATVTDANNVAVAGVTVTFALSGVGRFQAGSSPQTATTGADGKATVVTTTASNETGQQTVTADITNGGSNQCGSAAGTPAGATSAGTCTASATNTITTATASPSATPTATTSPRGTASPSTPPGGRQNLTLRTTTPLIPAGANATLIATGSANQQYELQCYTRPSTTYVTARSGAFDASGNPVTFTLSLGRNTRCFIQYATNPASGVSPSLVVNVRTVLSLSTVRTAVRTYVFQGRNLPRVAGQLITLYRVDNAGNEIRTTNLITDSTGIYRVTRKFTGTGTFRFKVRTPQTLNNAAGVSNTISVRIF